MQEKEPRIRSKPVTPITNETKTKGESPSRDEFDALVLRVRDLESDAAKHDDEIGRLNGIVRDLQIDVAVLEDLNADEE